MKLASTGFIIPFIFAFDNSLLLSGSPVNAVIAVITGALGCVVLSMAVSGWMLRKLSVPFRLAFLAGGVLLIISGNLMLNVAGLAISGALIVLLMAQNKSKAA